MIPSAEQANKIFSASAENISVPTSTATNIDKSEITVSKNGTVLIIASITFTTSSNNGSRASVIAKNNLPMAGTTNTSPSSGANQSILTGVLVDAKKGDTFCPRAFHNNGIDINVNAQINLVYL